MSGEGAAGPGNNFNQADGGAGGIKRQALLSRGDEKITDESIIAYLKIVKDDHKLADTVRQKLNVSVFFDGNVGRRLKMR